MDHPVDTPLSAASRFLVELAAWILTPWALGRVSVNAAVTALVVLMALPATFNTPGDKKVTGVPVSGRVRITIEGVLFVAAAWGAVQVLPGPLGVIAVIVLVAVGVVQVPRWRWLAPRAATAPARP